MQSFFPNMVINLEMDVVVRDAKLLITKGDKEGLEAYYMNLIEIYDTSTIDFPYLFRHIYVHACLKKKHEIVSWLKELYETMDPIMKIALRQIFAYGDYLIRA